jgi:hypothetical protein
MKARVSNLYKTETEWNRLDFTPLPGELIVYAPDEKYTYARAKVGDGTTTLHELPFFTEASITAKLAEFQFTAVADAGIISDYF